MNILVRNLSREVSREELWQMFLHFGKIRSLTLVMDPVTGKSKGFGFVDMPKEVEGAAAIKALNGSLIRGEKVRVKVTNQSARPSIKKPMRARPERSEFRERKVQGRRADTCWRGANRRNPGPKRGK
jgi:RNA recognition motif-containing protein